MLEKQISTFRDTFQASNVREKRKQIVKTIYGHYKILCSIWYKLKVKEIHVKTFILGSKETIATNFRNAIKFKILQPKMQ